MTTAIVRAAFETRLATWAAAQVPAIPVAWENRKFDPPAAVYLRAFLISAPTLSSTLDRRHREYAGIFQVSIVAPVSGGMGPIQTVVEGLAALFPVSQPMVQNGLNVWLRDPIDQGPTITESDRVTVPVRATYRLDAE